MSKQTPDHEWHPIATAPKDGTAILLFCPVAPEGGWGRERVNSNIVVGAYLGRSWDNNGYWICDVMEIEYGYYDSASLLAVKIEPSHWMPLPPEP